jgi:hypothetical protein
VTICKFPFTHIQDNVLNSEHGGTGYPLVICLGLLCTALQGRSYISYGHLDISIIDGGCENVWPVAVIFQIFIKRPDQTFVGNGYNWLEQPLQASALLTPELPN